MNIQDSIVVIENYFCKDLQKRLIDFIDYRAKEKLGIRFEKNENIRNVFGHHLRKNNVADIAYFNLIQREIDKAYPFYKIKFPFLNTTKIDQIDLLKYSEKQHYAPHVDHSFSGQRTLSIIINLNNDYEGGELVFYGQDSKEIKKIKMNSRTIVFFPSNFLFPHSILPFTKGIRYSVVLWLT